MPVMLLCISPVPVILHTAEPPRKTKIGSRNRSLRNRRWNPLKSKPRETKIGSRNREFKKSKMESTEIKAKGYENWFELSGGSRKRDSTV